ncbi:complement factor H-related protein 5-like [Astatotilapia calliptera]|uniref:complement factor H-related protein 5-like n=1 Tax=Astatotilapia calliptera TaxID=8154 RepID=UPI000E3FAA32|nr:complement factor H-related protein 5-like [Astatotilapia calliptera]
MKLLKFSSESIRQKNMKLSLILLFLQLWGCVEVSLSQNVCSELPNVPHAHVSEGTSKAVYQEGDVIHFSCESGYISDQISKFVCTADGWLVVHQGKCYSCSTLPDVPHAQVTQETRTSQYQAGHMIHFACEPGYTSALTIKYVCTTEGWQPLQRGSCYLSSSRCDPPPTVQGLTVKGLPENCIPIRPNHILTFSCDGPGKYLNGISVLICGEDGQWNNPFPTCIDRSCKIGVMDPHLYVAGLPPSNEIMATGHKLRFLCSNTRVLIGSTEIECLENGQWNSPFPSCSEKCRVPETPAGLTITTDVTDDQMKKGQHLTFACENSNHIIKGNATLECLENGQWSNPRPTCEAAQQCRTPPHLSGGQTKTWTRNTYRHNEKVEYVCDRDYSMEGGPFKTCVDGDWVGEMRCRRAQGCGRPPPLSDGDTKTSTKQLYQHNEKVEYICQHYYVMKGGPFKTCNHGEWTGEIRCLQACTVNRDDMNRHNIQFRFSRDDKLYTEHGDVIEFTCFRGRPVGTLGMRQKCEDGVVHLPTCQ